ncbi:MAG: hypothetical protein ABF932_09640 [Gluconobacter potus]|uniref:Uncharacterized protein n=2 Tax=Gluconobacter TaxID=441 RepID=A0A829WM47_GLUOY|nr:MULTISPECIES: hypothetical protein [Gluconobacter]MBF0865597.1 hypothetical protein [Gluconobacter sp. R71656]MBF0868619.1 hypothetical protein [Gluconobacter sp. R75628]MBF0874552.1 hypothetical protein [Gluconobacter sp. R75629]MBF0883627.1 hypothetical protein [Gluconobacter potus]GEM17888.1 hypothetical protein NBRC3293_2385 [Gluconobacter oxydans NBRC 3293]
MKMERLVKRHVASAAAGLFRSETLRNTIIGASRALDPNPQVDTKPVTYAVRGMSFSGGFAQDRQNLMQDRIRGEGRIFEMRALTRTNGKTSRYA